MNNSENRIHYLVENYTFEQLSKEDKHLILSELSEAEFNTMRRIALTNNANETLPPLPSHVYNNLQEELGLQQENKSTYHASSIFMPLLWLSIGVAIAYGYLELSHTTEKASNEVALSPMVISDTVYIEVKDTVLVTIEKDPIVIVKEKVIYSDKNLANAIVDKAPLTPLETINTPIVSQSSQSLRNNYFTNVDLTEITPTKVGKTIGEEEELMSLLNEIASDGIE